MFRGREKVRCIRLYQDAILRQGCEEGSLRGLALVEEVRRKRKVCAAFKQKRR